MINPQLYEHARARVHARTHAHTRMHASLGKSQTHVLMSEDFHQTGWFK